MRICPPSISLSELHKISILSQFKEPQLNKIQKHMKLIHLAENEHLFEHGDIADKFYLVKSGQIKLFRIFLEGSERVVDVIQPGEVFSESYLFLENGRYPLGAEALIDTELLSFDCKVFKSILEESKDACFQLMSNLSLCLQQHIDQVDCLALQNADFRLINYLLQQVPDDHKTNTTYIINLTMPKNILASCLFIKPETFSRTLKTLRNRNLIDVNGSEITIHNVNQLKEVAA
ncbi:MAG: Crp/Fnr family transcriptional regulator [endosymbiont of Galathealinum brachiosum]|uniref:Crp/Fnr family transcriptional regulator n=1 Tax=endosymbiont of Galathealinum brachiosum TaxID=2200906 RepID=A0A370DIJ3_9GAMM|nr:MAG: Crp/Fnr family transcriptional regulator [endosymbiont of Galathealinum brachiosum]